MKKVLMSLMCITFLAGCSKTEIIYLSEHDKIVEEKDNEIEKLKEDINYLKEITKDVEFKFYVGDIDDYSKVNEVGTLILPNALSLEQKMVLLLDEISKIQFSGLSITLNEIKIEDGKKIAYINLTESSKDSTWKFGFFQGTAGGAVTQNTLIETVLQREFDGEWIDGVHFNYYSEIIETIDFDHVSFLNKVIIR